MSEEEEEEADCSENSKLMTSFQRALFKVFNNSRKKATKQTLIDGNKNISVQIQAQLAERL